MSRRMDFSRHWLAICIAVNTLSGAAAQDGVTPQRRTAAQPVSQIEVSTGPIVIAHRGASGYLPEHTTEAAAFAHALNADYIEQDCVLSKDGVAVVLHDLTLERVTDVAKKFPDRKRDNGRWYVMDLTWAELQQLNVHERFEPPKPGEKVRGRFPRNEARFRIASLAQHLKLIDGMNRSRGTQTGVYVEIKSPAEHHRHGLDVSKAVLTELERAGYSSGDKPIYPVYLQCFEKDEVRRIRVDLNCRLPLIQLLSKPPTAKEMAQIATIADGVGVPVDTVVTGIRQASGETKPLISNLVKMAHDNAMQVHVWTFRLDVMPDFCDDSELLLNWLVNDAGVDGVFTDHPDSVVKWRAASNRTGRRNGTFHLLKNRSTESRDAGSHP